jgi:hypothetical protein
VFITNHVLSGAIIGQAFDGHPVGAFVAGVGSHLVLDAVPHWGCDIDAPGGSERFLRAATRDGLLGLVAIPALLGLVAKRSRVATLAGIAGAVLLDLDKPASHFFNVDLFPPFVQRIHGRVQNESPDGMRREVAAGAILAASDLAVTARRRRTRRAVPDRVWTSSAH